MSTIIVTRHKELIAYLLEIGLITGNEPVIAHATTEDVRGKRVIGVLPLSLAALAASVTEVPLNLTPDMRGKDLTLDDVRRVAGTPVTYKVEVIHDA